MLTKSFILSDLQILRYNGVDYELIHSFVLRSNSLLRSKKRLKTYSAGFEFLPIIQNEIVFFLCSKNSLNFVLTY